MFKIKSSAITGKEEAFTSEKKYQRPKFKLDIRIPVPVGDD